MLDLMLILLFKLLLWFSLGTIVISGVLLVSLLIITSDATKLTEQAIDAFLKLILTLVIAGGIYALLPSSSFLSKIEKGVYYKLTQEYKLPVKNKK